LVDRVQRGHRVRDRAWRSYQAHHADPALHFGCGPQRLAGWLNVDLVAGDVHVDLERPLPFEDGIFAYAFGEHVVGSLSERGGMRLLRELHRVLRPGGVLRLTTPDLAKLVALYRDDHQETRQRDYVSFLDRETGKTHATACQALNDALRLWGIRFSYDHEDLALKLGAAGFTEIEHVEHGASAHVALRGVERHGDPWLSLTESLCLEARRSA